MAETDKWKSLFKQQASVSNFNNVTEKITGPFGDALIDQSGIVNETLADSGKALVVLDNACGTGIISKMLHEKVDVQTKSKWSLTCGDLFEVMLECAKREAQHGEWSNVDFAIVDAQDTGLPSDHFSHVFTSFGQSLL